MSTIPFVPSSQSNIIIVASGKGGVGKTCFSINLAYALAKEGKKVLLFDGDLGLANIDIQLGLMPKRDLGQTLIEGYALKEAIEPYELGGFDIIAGRSGSGVLAILPPEKLKNLRDNLHIISQQYDKVIVDLGAGIGATVRAFTELPATCLVVTNDEPTSLTDAYALIKVTRGHAPEGLHYGIIINGASGFDEGQKIYAGLLNVCQNFLKLAPPLAGVIRRDGRVKEAIRAQSLLLIRYPVCEAAQDIEAISQCF